MQMHSNKVLQVMEQTWIGKCRKRWLLAILANMGFMISFGIRCNFGAAKTHMYKNYTDPYGKVHVRHDKKIMQKLLNLRCMNSIGQ